jgi:hypothetical protein
LGGVDLDLARVPKAAMLGLMRSRATRSEGWNWSHPGDDGWRATGRRAAARRAAMCVAVLGCSAAPGEGRTLGTDLGTFGVEATQSINECGPGALGSSASFGFDVELELADTELFWDGRVGGRIGPKHDFEFSASSSFELRPARAGQAGCSVVRTDQISGVLEPDASGAFTAFSGEMRFEFAAKADSACTVEEQAQVELPRLPCRMSYALSADRTRAPKH